MESSSTQTELVMAEVEAMVLNSKKELETLEVAVQTLELESSGGFRVRESEVEKKLDSRQILLMLGMRDEGGTFTLE